MAQDVLCEVNNCKFWTKLEKKKKKIMLKSKEEN